MVSCPSGNSAASAVDAAAAAAKHHRSATRPAAFRTLPQSRADSTVFSLLPLLLRFLSFCFFLFLVVICSLYGTVR